MSTPKWIEFRLAVEQPDSGKTRRWDVVTKGGEKEVGGIVLGRVFWWGAWRKYAFFPAAATLYEPTCLRDIATFIEDEMRKRRA